MGNYTDRALECIGETLASKGEDYAGADEFGNFRLGAQFLDTPSHDVVLVHVLQKIARIRNLRDKGEPNYESLEDSFKDLAGYAILAYAAYLEANY